MKTILIATAAILASGSAFAMQQGPVNVGNYDASVQSQYRLQYRISWARSRSARATR